MKIINTRADLDALKGTPKYLAQLKLIAGTLVCVFDAADYPDNYNDPTYDGPQIDPVWTKKEDLITILSLGFSSREEFEAEYEAATATE